MNRPERLTTVSCVQTSKLTSLRCQSPCPVSLHARQGDPKSYNICDSACTSYRLVSRLVLAAVPRGMSGTMYRAVAENVLDTPVDSGKFACVWRISRHKSPRIS